MLPPVHPPPACDATPSACSKSPTVGGLLSGRRPPPRAILPLKSRNQNTDGATATNPSSRRATDAPPCAPEAAPPDNSPRSSRCKPIPFFNSRPRRSSQPPGGAFPLQKISGRQNLQPVETRSHHRAEIAAIQCQQHLGPCGGGEKNGTIFCRAKNCGPVHRPHITNRNQRRAQFRPVLRGLHGESGKVSCDF